MFYYPLPFFTKLTEFAIYNSFRTLNRITRQETASHDGDPLLIHTTQPSPTAPPPPPPSTTKTRAPPHKRKKKGEKRKSEQTKLGYNYGLFVFELLIR